jgi:RNA polymerase sigma-70 factor (ECF subfamily)
MGPSTTTAVPLATETLQQVDFTYIFGEHFDYVWFTLRRFGVAARDLDDVAHDVFVLVYQHLDKYDPGRPIRPWLFGFAYRAASDYRRLARHRVEILDEPSEGVDAAPSAIDRAASRQALDLVWTALEQLDLDRRAVFVLHDVEGYSVPEVADALDVPLNTAYSRLRIAREQFTKTMQRLHAQRGGK